MTRETLFSRQPLLVSFAIVLLLFCCVTLWLQGIDHRLIDGVNVWVKPTKFLISIAVFSVTQAFFMGYVQPSRRSKWHVQFAIWGLLVFSAFEIAYIVWQAHLGQVSHFNISDPFHIIMYALMGVGAVALTLTMLPLAYEIERHPVLGLQSEYRFAIVAALYFSTFVTLAVAGYMSSQAGHFVGATGAYLPIMGWNLVGGDLRVAHFFALHAHQLFPLAALIVARADRRMAWSLLIGFMLLYAGVTGLTFVEALKGVPAFNTILGYAK